MCVTLVLCIAVAAAAHISLVMRDFLRHTEFQVKNLSINTTNIVTHKHETIIVAPFPYPVSYVLRFYTTNFKLQIQFD